MIRKKIIWFLVGGISGILVANHPLVQYYLHTPLSSVSSVNHDAPIQAIDQVFTILQEEYYDKEKISLTGMREGGIKGFVASLKDPYTEYFTVDQNKDFEQQLQGNEEFEGIGAAVEKKEDGVRIQEVFKSTPAAVAGLRPNDMIMQIDGESTKDLTISEAVQKIRGPKGTQVKLLIFRASETDPAKRVFTVDVTRENVKIPSVQIDTISVANRNIAYIEIALIGDQTETLLKQEIAALAGKRVDGVILDLRGNGGGYLPKAVEIASHFIPKDKIIVTGRYSILPTEQFVSKGYGDFENVPVVILVDTLTASAGEIIAGAMRYHRGSILVGTTTFGKGSIQTISEIGSGAGLKYTIGKWYLPDDTNIDRIGITPDIDIPFDRARYEKDRVDVQKQRAIDEITKLLSE